MWPDRGYVIVPCIERNAVFSVKALNTANYVMSVGSDHHIISFDEVVKTMYETGKDLVKNIEKHQMVDLLNTMKNY